jgi:hypothetical protein
MGMMDVARVAFGNRARVLRAVAASKHARLLMLRRARRHSWMAVLAAGVVTGGVLLGRRMMA